MTARLPRERASASERAVRDAGKLFTAHIGAGAVSVAFSAWLYRVVPEHGIALWPIALSAGGAISALGSFGVGDSFVRVVPDLIARGREHEAAAMLRTGILLNALGCAALSVVLWVLAEPAARLLLREPEMARYVRPLAVAAFSIALRVRLASGLQAIQEFGKQAFLRFFVDALRSPLAVVGYLWWHVHGLILALTVVALVDCVLALYWLRRYLFAHRGFHPVGPLLRFSLPYYGVSLSGFLQSQAHYLVVGAVGGAAALTPYFVAYRLAEYLRSLDHMSVDAVTPKLTERAGSDPERRPAIFTKCMRYLFLGLLPLHVGAAALARPLLDLYGGSGYAQAAPIFMLLCVGLFIQALNFVYRAHIQVFSPPSHLLALHIAAGVSTLAGLLILVPTFGPVGAAASRIVVPGAMQFAHAWFLRRTMRLESDLGAIAWAGAGGMLIAAVCLSAQVLLGSEGVTVLVIASVASAAGYAALLWGRVSQADLDVAFGVLPGSLRRRKWARRLRRFAESRMVAEKT